MTTYTESAIRLAAFHRQMDYIWNCKAETLDAITKIGLRSAYSFSQEGRGPWSVSDMWRGR